jgi:predicted transcriptional regulator
MHFKKITIIRTEISRDAEINEQIQLFGGSLGLFNPRDKDKSCYRIFITLLKNLKKEGLSSDELAEKTGLTRGTVVHHLNKLMDADIVINHRKGYILNVDNIQGLIQRIKKDINKTLDDLDLVAKELDKQLGLE